MKVADELEALSPEAKKEIADRMWTIAKRFGADRACLGCDKVVRKIANGRDEGHACICRNVRRPL